jgi:hypothetical protein
VGLRLGIALASGSLFEGKTSGTHLLDVGNPHQAVLDATGLAFVLYDLRHTFATRFDQATKDVVALKEVLGREPGSRDGGMHQKRQT